MEYVLKNLSDTLTVNSVANVHFFEFSENFYTSVDKHPFYELIFVASGSLNITGEYYSGQMQKNSLIIHRKNELHSLTCPKDTKPSVIIIGFSCSNNEIDKFSLKPVQLESGEIKKLAEIIKEGRNVFAPPYNVPVFDMKKKKTAPFCSEQMLKILLEYFLIGLSRRFSTSYVVEETKKSEKVSIDEITNYLSDNFCEKITIDELAFIFRTNRSTLCKLFKQHTGKTVIEYLNDKKLVVAKHKILNTEKTLTEIAYELNFDSIHYFTRFFKKMTGISPKQYRKNLTRN